MWPCLVMWSKQLQFLDWLQTPLWQLFIYKCVEALSLSFNENVVWSWNIEACLAELFEGLYFHFQFGIADVMQIIRRTNYYVQQYNNLEFLYFHLCKKKKKKTVTDCMWESNYHVRKALGKEIGHMETMHCFGKFKNSGTEYPNIQLPICLSSAISWCNL